MLGKAHGKDLGEEMKEKIMKKTGKGKMMRCFLTMIMAMTMVGISTISGFAEVVSLEDTWEGIKYSQAAILYEATTDTVLYEKDADVQRSPASMTKVMTAIIVLEQNPNLEGELTVNPKAVKHYYCSSMEMTHLEAGEVISYEDCMNYMLIPSANEAATAFAFELGDGDIHNFIDMMNEKAKELGCESTSFQDPTGISPHLTTARDMVKIVQYAMTFDKFREIVGKGQGTVPASNKRDKSFDYYTTNYVSFPDDRYECPYTQYMKGVKTGYTPAAGWCFAGCMERDGLVYYSVVMGGELQEYTDGERVIQGDFIDTINLYRMTDGVTKEDLEAMHPVTVPVWLVAVVGGVLSAMIVYVVARKRRRNQ
ncbi:MAG: D-alanyl-D-alanine carboxypeptidase [Firmicutes bacterium]|nr:D-alanyl-D-alanine carboxypeptidase [Bacillota bacterium]